MLTSRRAVVSVSPEPKVRLSPQALSVGSDIAPSVNMRSGPSAVFRGTLIIFGVDAAAAPFFPIPPDVSSRDRLIVVKVSLVGPVGQAFQPDWAKKVS